MNYNSADLASLSTINCAQSFLFLSDLKNIVNLLQKH